MTLYLLFGALWTAYQAGMTTDMHKSIRDTAAHHSRSTMLAGFPLLIAIMIALWPLFMVLYILKKVGQK